MANLNSTSRNLLMIAVEYPPCNSAGVQRTLKFSELLPQFGWNPVVLTADIRAYEKVEDQTPFPRGVNVYRSFSLDSLRHLRIKGKYLRVTTMPDRYATWYFSAIVKGLYLIRKHKPTAIYSSFPYTIAHAIAMTLSKLTGLPWLADYRDPAHHHYLPPSFSNPLARWIDKKTADNAQHIIFATEKMRSLYCSRYTSLSDKNTTTIENGYNESMFDSHHAVTSENEEFILLHSGALIIGRDPNTLIEALGQLLQSPTEHHKLEKLRIHFRGAQANEERLALVEKYNLQNKVRFLPSISYQESLQEMLSADALLLLQGDAFNFQIPGKAYEYIATQKPIITITDTQGATAELMQQVTSSYIAQMGDLSAIKTALGALMGEPKELRDIKPYGRLQRTKQLSQSLEQAICQP